MVAAGFDRHRRATNPMQLTLAGGDGPLAACQDVIAQVGCRCATVAWGIAASAIDRGPTLPNLAPTWATSR
jgi:hypothetical protein